MSSRKKRKRLALGRHKSADTRTATDGCTKENTSENDDRPTSHSPIVGVGEHSPEPVYESSGCMELPVAVRPSQCVVSTSLNQHFSSTTASPSSLHNLTVTYHYHQSPISSSTRSMSELCSVLPSDGASLKNLCPVNASPSLPSLPYSHTAPSPASPRPVRKRLKIASDSPQSADVQRLLNIASQLCRTNDESTKTHQAPCPNQLSLALQQNEDTQHDSATLQFPEHEAGDDGDEHHCMMTCDHDGVSDDDNAFWTQAADVVERREWEEDPEGERDSAFLDEVLSSSLLLSPLLSESQAHVDRLTPHSNHSLSPSSTPNCTLHTYHSAVSDTVNTPLSHRHGAQHKPHPLF